MITPYKQDPGHLEQIVEIAHEAIVTINSDQRIVAFNRGAERMFGYSRGEMLGTSLDRLLPAPVARHHSQLAHHFLNCSPQDRTMAPRRPVRARNAEGQEFEVLITLYSTGTGDSAIATAVIVAPSERRESNEQLRRLLEQNRRNGIQLLKRENDYRRRLAQLIHNDLSQEAVSIGVNLELARQYIPEQKRELEELFTRINNAIQRVHDTVDQLINQTRLPLLDSFTLAEAVADCIRRLGIRDSGLIIEEMIDPDVEQLQDPAKTIAYRIVQESLTNIMRHARPAASKVSLEIRIEKSGPSRSRLLLRIDDDGHGCQPSDTEKRSGIGIQQMREWCTALGGHLTTSTSPWGGFRVSGIFPIEGELS
ncbi:PAS domain S-box-containing protein [Natronospira proteinivora]|uniref:PAS domain S-box-containing protein n=1 Tax=Natronospira proteinivora TaxID=1807133 RepID=A0ABT1G619_9GAMM|nr:PAS domain S-box protein [Natronospira proteinivora]MCP1726385.1 PAS domain S-box-containing protein [Natronospira proteinivora]